MFKDKIEYIEKYNVEMIKIKKTKKYVDFFLSLYIELWLPI